MQCDGVEHEKEEQLFPLDSPTTRRARVDPQVALFYIRVLRAELQRSAAREKQSRGRRAAA